jgi:uncharacterized protein
MSKMGKTTKIAIQAHPGAKKNEILRFEAGVWHLKIAAPPAEGKANKELIEFLSEILDISKSHLSIEKGTTSHRKLISIQGLAQTTVDERLKKVAG